MVKTASARWNWKEGSSNQNDGESDWERLHRSNDDFVLNSDKKEAKIQVKFSDKY